MCLKHRLILATLLAGGLAAGVAGGIYGWWWLNWAGGFVTGSAAVWSIAFMMAVQVLDRSMKRAVMRYSRNRIRAEQRARGRKLTDEEISALENETVEIFS